LIQEHDTSKYNRPLQKTMYQTCHGTSGTRVVDNAQFISGDV